MDLVYLLAVYALTFRSYASSHALPFSKEKLYDDKDPLTILNSTDFYKNVLSKNNIWIIEFYNSWCGHCKRFAPTWVEFAEDITSWKNVAEVGVLDCSESSNTDICRDYMVNAFPTIRMFWVHMSKNDIGEELSNARDVVTLRRQVVRFIDTHWVDGVPNTWPQLKALSSSDISSALKTLPPKTKSYVILEDQNSYLGKEIILDLSSVENSKVFRTIYNADENNSALFGSVTENQVPTLYNMTGGQTDIVEPRLRGHPDLIRTQMKKLIFGHTQKGNMSKQLLHESTNSVALTHDHPQSLITSRVYMVDLENTLSYIFRTEVGIHFIIKDDDLSALKLMLEILTKYFPGRPEVLQMLKSLKAWMDVQSTFNIKDMLKEIVNLTSSQSFLPPMREWVGCKGSIPGYRGYPCGVWQLFHTLSVEAHRKFIMKEDTSNPHRVMIAMREYIEHFFSCQECAKHFLQMSNNLDHDLQSPNDTVLWLWWAHNNVNRRLAGDFTEDPAYPKIQFPTENLCYDCRKIVQNDNTQVHWNLNEVLNFLLKFYSKSRIDLRSIATRNIHVSNIPDLSYAPIEIIPSRGHFKESIGFGYFNEFDLSLCLFLYVGSGGLLMILYFMFIVRRKRRKLSVKMAIVT